MKDSADNTQDGTYIHFTGLESNNKGIQHENNTKQKKDLIGQILPRIKMSLIISSFKSLIVFG